VLVLLARVDCCGLECGKLYRTHIFIITLDAVVLSLTHKHNYAALPQKTVLRSVLFLYIYPSVLLSVTCKLQVLTHNTELYPIRCKCHVRHVGDPYMLIKFLTDFQYVVDLPLFPTSE